jgi:hypothetical protein
VKVLYVVSDQKENATAIKGVSEADLCAPIGRAAVVGTKALGHEASYFDPRKTYDIKPALIWAPEVVVLIHVNATGAKRPQGVMGVECGHAARSTDWAREVIQKVAAGIGWPVWGISTDEKLRGFCFYFFEDMREVGSRGKRLVIELGNMQCFAQATFLKDNPQRVGDAIARALCPDLSTQGDEEMTEEQVRAIAREEIAAATSIVHKPDEVATAQQTLIEAGLLARGRPTERPASIGYVDLLLARLWKALKTGGEA